MARPALHWQIAAALALSVIAGITLGQNEVLLESSAFLGTMFLNALKMLIVPLVLSAMISGLAAIPDTGAMGRFGLRTLAFYVGSGLVAILTGLLAVNLIQPGIIDGLPAGERLGLAAGSGEVLKQVQGHGGGEMLAVLQRLIPQNVFKAAADGDMLGLVTFGFLFGYFVSQLPEALNEAQRTFWQGIYEAMIRVAKLVMAFAPIGVFALVAPVIAKTGWAAFRPLAWFIVAALSALAAHFLVTQPLILKLIARVSPLRHLRVMAPALLTAFSTSSSAATLPVTIDCLENKAGVSRRVTGFVLPIGANVNTDGTALYECAAAMFIAQAYGLPLGFGTQFTIVLAALLTSVGVAGIPSASLVAIAVILSAIGLPLEGIGMILAVDRVLDMCRTAVNVYGDSVAAIVVARLEGEAVLGAPPLRGVLEAG